MKVQTNYRTKAQDPVINTGASLERIYCSNNYHYCSFEYTNTFTFAFSASAPFHWNEKLKKCVTLRT